MLKLTKSQLDSKAWLLKDGFINKSTKLTIFIKSVSRSGMSRKMIVMANDMDITYHVINLIGQKFNPNSPYVKVGGCGMDMAFWLADHISYYLFEDDKTDFQGNGGSCLDWRTIY